MPESGVAIHPKELPEPASAVWGQLRASPATGDPKYGVFLSGELHARAKSKTGQMRAERERERERVCCLLYTSDAADDM
eukprot:15475636-Alexandrium_andersonii.AAC.1